MMEIRDSGLYRDVLGFDTFEAYCKSKWDMGRRNAYYLIDAASVVDNVKRVAQIDSPSTLRQTIPLARLEPDQQREAWAKAVETAPEGRAKNILTFFERSFYTVILEGAIFPGAQRGTSGQHSPGKKISVFFYARGIGPSPFPCVGCNRGQVPGDHPGDIESTLERAAWYSMHERTIL